MCNADQGVIAGWVLITAVRIVFKRYCDVRDLLCVTTDSINRIISIVDCSGSFESPAQAGNPKRGLSRQTHTSQPKQTQPKDEERNPKKTTTTMTTKNETYPVVGEESIMKPKKHGTSETPVQKNLRWGCDYETADRICNHNRHYAEHSGYFPKTSFIKDSKAALDAGEKEITFYDSNTGKPLFVAPRGRTFQQFLDESNAHGWPSFRDEEVIWDDVRCLPDGETVSLAGTHLGHNLPDRKGNRYCINLVSVAGNPEGK